MHCYSINQWKRLPKAFSTPSRGKVSLFPPVMQHVLKCFLNSHMLSWKFYANEKMMNAQVDNETGNKCFSSEALDWNSNSFRFFLFEKLLALVAQHLFESHRWAESIVERNKCEFERPSALVTAWTSIDKHAISVRCVDYFLFLSFVVMTSH